MWVVAALSIPLALTLLWWYLPIASWLVAAVEQVSTMGLMGYALYLLVYVVLASLSVPTTPLNVGAGVIFGLVLGLPIALAGGLSAALLVFVFARYVFSNRVRAKLERYERFERLSAVVREQSFKIVLLTRLNPLLPASVKNYTFALAGVPLRTYALATLCGQFPIVIIHVYLGWAGGSAMMTGHAGDGVSTWLLIAGVGLSIVLFAVFSWYGHHAFERRMGTATA